MMWYYGWNWWFGGGLFMFLFMLAFWVLAIAFVVWLVRYIAHGPSNGMTGGSKNALDILKERYAKGKIDKTEFESKKKDLQE